MYRLRLILAFVLAAIALLSLIFAVDHITSKYGKDDQFSLKIDTVKVSKYDSACNIQVEKLWNKELKLGTNGEGKYVIILNSPIHGKQFLSRWFNTIHWFDRPYDIFEDSCEAKTFALEFEKLKNDEQNKINSFK